MRTSRPPSWPCVTQQVALAEARWFSENVEWVHFSTPIHTLGPWASLLPHLLDGKLGNIARVTNVRGSSSQDWRESEEHCTGRSAFDRLPRCQADYERDVHEWLTHCRNGVALGQAEAYPDYIGRRTVERTCCLSTWVGMAAAMARSRSPLATQCRGRCKRWRPSHRALSPRSSRRGSSGCLPALAASSAAK